MPRALYIVAALTVATNLQVMPACLAQKGAPQATGAIAPPMLDEKSNFRCEALLRVEPATVPTGGTFKVVCEVQGRREPADLYNAMLSERYKLPAQIVITSADGKLRRDILKPSSMNVEKSDAHCWTYLRPDRSIGREFVCKIARPTGEGSDDSRTRIIDLPPGEYFVQATYNHWLISSWLNRPSRAGGRPTDGTGDEPRPLAWAPDMKMDEPIAISKSVKLVVTAGGATTGDAAPAADCPLQLDLTWPLTEQTVQGPKSAVGIRLTNRSDNAITVFNPSLDSRLFFLEKSLDLSVSRLNGVNIGNYINEYLAGSSRPPTIRDWARFPPGGTTSIKFTFVPDRVPQTDFDGRQVLPTGTYLLELVGHEALLAPIPSIFKETDNSAAIAGHASYINWRRAFPGPEICRSNRVGLEILLRAGD